MLRLSTRVTRTGKNYLRAVYGRVSRRRRNYWRNRYEQVSRRLALRTVASLRHPLVRSFAEGLFFGHANRSEAEEAAAITADALSDMTSGEHVYAPFSPEQVEGLRAWQACNWVHPFTCCEHVTMAVEPRGFVCPKCEGVQTWAWGFMADGPPPNPLASIFAEA